MTRVLEPTGGDSLPYPADDPDTVRLAGARVAAVGTDLYDVRTRLTATAGQAPEVWAGVAENRCAAEVAALGALLGRAGDGARAAREALDAYARSLDVARAEIDALRRRRDVAVAECDAAVRSLAVTMPDAPPPVRAPARRDEQEVLQWRLTDIHGRHAAVLDGVRQGAVALAARLDAAAAAVRGGTGSADVRHGVLSALPLLDEREAGAAAEQAAAWLRASSYDDRWLDGVGRFEQWANDPYFAARLLDELGPEELLRIPYFLAVSVASRCDPTSLEPLTWDQQQAVHARSERLLAFLSTALAAGTRTGAPASVDDAWVRGLLGAADAGMGGETQGWWSVGQLLQRGQFDTGFLVRVATAADAADRGTDWRWWRMSAPMAMTSGGYNDPGSTAGGWDPMVGVLAALAKNRTAALQFLTPDRLDHALTARGGWGDDGAALGRLLVTAAGVERDLASAEVTARMVRDLGAHGGRVPDGAREGVADVLAAHIGDVAFAISTGAGTPLPGAPLTAPGNLPWLDDAQPPAALVGAGDLALVLRGVTADADAFRSLVDAQAAWAKVSIEGAARLAGPQDQVVAGVEATAADAATVFGFLTAAHDAGTSDAARAADAAHNRLVDLARAGAGLVPVPGGKLVDFGVDQLLDSVAGGLHSDQLSAAQHASAQDALATRTLVVDSVATAMTGAQLIPAGHDPVTWLAQQPPQVRTHPFVDDAGRLLPPSRMDADAWRSYSQWLHEPQGASATIGVTTQRVDDRYEAARATASQYLR